MTIAEFEPALTEARNRLQVAMWAKPERLLTAEDRAHLDELAARVRHVERALDEARKLEAMLAPTVRRRPDAAVGQMEIWFTPTASEAKRAEVLAKMRQPLRIPRSSRCTRAAWERRGAAVLATADQPIKSPRVPWTVRVYYQSMADELVYFEAAGLTQAQAGELVGYGVAAQHWVAHGCAPAPLQGARLVVLPSQRTERVEALVDSNAQEAA
jgi:hypothetical protein